MIPSASRPSTGEEPMGVAPGREQRGGEEMGKQGTLHPGKHPGSSAGVVPEHRHKQTDSNTQTDSDTHRNPHAQPALPFPAGPPPPTPRLLGLPPRGSHPRSAFTQPGTEAVPPHLTPSHRWDEFSDASGLVPSHHLSITPGGGSHEELGGSLLPGDAKRDRNPFTS